MRTKQQQVYDHHHQQQRVNLYSFFFTSLFLHAHMHRPSSFHLFSQKHTPSPFHYQPLLFTGHEFSFPSFLPISLYIHLHPSTSHLPLNLATKTPTRGDGEFKNNQSPHHTIPPILSYNFTPKPQIAHHTTKKITKQQTLPKIPSPIIPYTH